MKILVFNCGSSSIKYQLINMSENPVLLAKGLLDRVGMKNGILGHTKEGTPKIKIKKDIANHEEGIKFILEMLTDKEHGVIADVHEINAAGHRVVHGGEDFSESVLITQEVLRDIEKCCALAPLHNPHNLSGILALQKVLPKIPQVAVFDTSFHATMPEVAYLYSLPYKFYDKYKLRRYGFHGTSHRFVSQKAAKMLGLDYEKQRIITCHLGNGASVAAIKYGKSVDTSMGFTPDEGLIMGTRCGDVGMGAILYIMEKEGLSVQQTTELINKRSGIIGISEISSDMRDIELEAEKGNARAQLSLDIYDYRIKKYIGAYAAVMGGVDIIVFTGGIGENAEITRGGVIRGLECLGVDFDWEKNTGLRERDEIISKPDSKVKVVVALTNEELVIAQDTYEIVK